MKKLKRLHFSSKLIIFLNKKFRFRNVIILFFEIIQINYYSSSLGLCSYMSISGLTKVTNVTFVNFNLSKCGVRDYVIATNPLKYFDFRIFTVFFIFLLIIFNANLVQMAYIRWI